LNVDGYDVNSTGALSSTSSGDQFKSLAASLYLSIISQVLTSLVACLISIALAENNSLRVQYAFQLIVLWQVHAALRLLYDCQQLQRVGAGDSGFTSSASYVLPLTLSYVLSMVMGSSALEVQELFSLQTTRSGLQHTGAHMADAHGGSAIAGSLMSLVMDGAGTGRRLIEVLVYTLLPLIVFGRMARAQWGSSSPDAELVARRSVVAYELALWSYLATAVLLLVGVLTPAVQRRRAAFREE
jgi:hypothetical protein